MLYFEHRLPLSEAFSARGPSIPPEEEFPLWSVFSSEAGCYVKWYEFVDNSDVPFLGKVLVESSIGFSFSSLTVSNFAVKEEDAALSFNPDVQFEKRASMSSLLAAVADDLRILNENLQSVSANIFSPVYSLF